MSKARDLADAEFATAAQGTTADSAVQPNDNPTFGAITATNEIRFEGDVGSNALIQKNATTGRDELQIYAGGDAYQTGSRGAGIHLYGNSDNQHDGNFAVLTGPDNNGDGRIIASGREDKTHVTIGNTIWDYVDDGDDHALLNLTGADAQPALLIEGAGATEGDIVTVTGEAMSFGHWDKATTTFTERMRLSSNGNVLWYEDTGGTAKLTWDASAESLEFGDSVKAIFGSGSDLSVYHDGSNSFINDQGAGDLRIQTNGNRVNLYDQANANVMAHFNTGGSVDLYHNGDKKLNTTSTGIDVKGSGDVAIQVKSTGTGDADATLILDAADTGESVVNFRQDGTSKARIEWFSAGSPDLNFVTEAGTNGVFDFQPNNSLAMRIDASGNVLVGKTSSTFDNTAGIGQFPSGRIYVTRDGGNCLYLNRVSSDGDIAAFYKNGSTSGKIVAYSGSVSYTGSAYGIYFNSHIIAPVNSTGTARVDNVMDIGQSAYRFDDIYATNGTIQTSDRNEKQDIEALSDAEQRVAVACKGLLRKFRWIDSVAEKGDNARIHFGIIAQDLQDAFTAEGLDAGRYAMFISTTWWETQTEVPAVEAVAEVLGEDGNVVTEAVEAKDAYTRTDTHETLEDAPEGATERTRLGVRYPELLAFIIAAL